jgi:uncharacterized protein (TIGR03435 family)
VRTTMPTILLAIAGAATPWTLVAQGPPQGESKPTFEVASVKPNKSGSLSSGTSTRNGQLTATNVTLRQMIRNAYNLQDFQIAGGPDWVDADRFDIIAKVEGEPAGPEQKLMMRALLAERFGLVTHPDTKEMPVYNLVLAKPDGKLGAGLRRVDCAKDPCGSTRNGRTSNLAVLTAKGRTMGDFAQTLSSIVAKIVIDKTVLDGPYDIDLTWSTDQTADTTRPSIFTALQEHLGLKLESARGAVDVLVIDHVEHPTPD